MGFVTVLPMISYITPSGVWNACVPSARLTAVLPSGIQYGICVLGVGTGASTTGMLGVTLMSVGGATGAACMSGVQDS